MTYSYNPNDLAVGTVNRVRFELGDIVPDGASPMMQDEEIELALQQYANDPLAAKIYLVERVLMRFAYEVDMSIDGASWSLNQRYERWKSILDQLKKEAAARAIAPMLTHPAATIERPPYFYKHMHANDDRTRR